MPQFQTAYLAGNLMLLTIWFILFVKRRDLRWEMILMSLFVLGSLGVSGVWFMNHYLIDYWRPTYLGILGISGIFGKLGLLAKGIEDIIFVFTFCGIAAVLYEEILGKRHLKKGRKKSLKFLLLFPAVMFISFFAVSAWGGINIIYADFIAYFSSAAIVWYFRRDLVKHSLLSGLFMGIFFLLFYYLLYLRIYPGIINAWWILSKTSGVFLFGIPLEEILWAFFMGLWVGPAYEFLMGLKDK
ncbi:MAG: hypothetical protein HY426_02770 [Candidatus Levybacteria bacterium]|nr:hypothetical protein [Candidatus Levybacteria bacterium]